MGKYGKIWEIYGKYIGKYFLKNNHLKMSGVEKTAGKQFLSTDVPQISKFADVASLNRSLVDR
jgi:hypothetical protein